MSRGFTNFEALSTDTVNAQRAEAEAASHQLLDSCRIEPMHMQGRSLVSQLNDYNLKGCGGHGTPTEAQVGNQSIAAPPHVTHQNAVATAVESHAPKGVTNANASKGFHGNVGGHGMGHGHGGGAR